MKILSFASSLMFAAALAACGDDTGASGTGGSGGAAGTGTGGAGVTSATTTAASTGQGGDATTATATATSTGGDGGSTGDGGAGGSQPETIGAICEDVALPPDNADEGACIEIGGQHACNPVTNEGCEGPEQCGLTQAADGSLNFDCYPGAGPEEICAFCDSTDTFCGIGLDCLLYYFPDRIGIDLDQECAKYCCEDSECGAGVCQPFAEEYGLGPGGLCVDRLLD